MRSLNKIRGHPERLGSMVETTCGSFNSNCWWSPNSSSKFAVPPPLVKVDSCVAWAKLYGLVFQRKHTELRSKQGQMKFWVMLAKITNIDVFGHNALRQIYILILTLSVCVCYLSLITKTFYEWIVYLGLTEHLTNNR